MKIVLNGNVINEEQAVVSVYDHGFLYGMGLFETFRTYGGSPFLLYRHLHRLAEGCRELDIAFEPKPAKLKVEVAKLLDANGLADADAYFRYTVTAGVDILGLPSDSYKQPTEVLYVKPLPAAHPSLYKEGKALQKLAIRRNSPEGALRHKSLHYMNNILAKKEMNRYPWAAGAEGLFLDAQGFLCEGIVSNVFFIKDGALHTPAKETGLLPGITRQLVMELADNLSIPFSEGWYRWEDLQQADEVFITNSIQELVPVSALFDEKGEAHPVESRGIGPMTQRLLTAYRQAAVSGRLEDGQ
ncbi:aminotransferase class IV [Paenibacillus cremeus]|uniref:4-amino-4-deoxychorismate lyase n=1 Tax=Paenibacillus cremeus TaxID=2163881 RepID=A0A559K3R4_9BACL|nr:aminotransferase class IV [Paenibacillus cremeus]TVY06774.1 4-amino-4-deoxychorismate lyase [Paenibacillus cremeus]